MHPFHSVPTHLHVCLFHSSKQFNMVIVTCRAAVLMLKWEPHVHSLEKEIRVQVRAVKISPIVFSSWRCFTYPKSRPLHPKRMAELLDNGKESKIKLLTVSPCLPRVEPISQSPCPLKKKKKKNGLDPTFKMTRALLLGTFCTCQLLASFPIQVFVKVFHH